MEYRQIILPERLNFRFLDEAEKTFVVALMEYLIYGTVPQTTPAQWQDMEIFIRYMKRDVWNVSQIQRDHAQEALEVYRVKYVIQHLTKMEILELLNEFFNMGNRQPIYSLLEKKLHAPLDDLLLIQEKRIVTKDDLSKLDEIFAYPAWIAFDDEAKEVLCEKILAGELSDEQVDYVLGASDDVKPCDLWYKIAKHLLMTTKNAHLFWIAGDVLNIVWKMAPDDEKTQKWFRDEIFEIFWPRVGSVWPILHKNLVEPDAADSGKILYDAIGWLESLCDLKERLPELGEDYKLPEHPSDEEEFAGIEGRLRGMIDAGADAAEMLEVFCQSIELVYSERMRERLEKIVDEKLVPAVKSKAEESEAKQMLKLIERGMAYTKKYLADVAHEQENIAQMIKEAQDGKNE